MSMKKTVLAEAVKPRERTMLDDFIERKESEAADRLIDDIENMSITNDLSVASNPKVEPERLREPCSANSYYMHLRAPILIDPQRIIKVCY